MTEKPKVLVLSGFGINCEYETAHAFEMAGAKCEIVHFNALAKNPKLFEEFQIFMLPGGWSFADDIQAGRVLANKFKFTLHRPLKKFIETGKPVIGICNGFQVLVQLGALPGWENWEAKKITLMANRNGRFEDRWVKLRTEACACDFAQGMDAMFALPIRHGEGQVVFADMASFNRLRDNKQVVFRYAGNDGLKATSYPDNPNGSADAIAGICNEAGNVLGMMPHPECHVRYLQNPHWTHEPPHHAPKGIIASALKKFGFGKQTAEDWGNCMPFFENIVSCGKKYI